MVRGEKAVVFSSLFFLLPWALAVYFQAWLSAVIILAVVISSLIYHFSGEKAFSRADAASARLLIANNFWICYLGDFQMPYWGFVLFFIAASLFVYFSERKRNYFLNHSLWHFFSAIITVLSLLTFISSQK